MESKTPLLALLFLLLAGLVGSLGVPSARAATRSIINVNTTTDELNNDGNCSLREAIRAANLDTAVDACPAGNGADTILVPSGIYTLTLTGASENDDATGDLDIRHDLTINGAGVDTTIIDGNGTDRVFDVLSSFFPFIPTQANFSGLTIRNGNPPDGFGGGGISFTGSTLNLSNVRLTGNRAGPGPGGGGGGGGFATFIGDATLTNVMIDHNQNGAGGADSLTATNVTVSSNDGRGIGNGEGRLTITNSRITDNGGTGLSGGGIVIVTNVIVSGNKDDSMNTGGISVGGNATLTDVVITNNTGRGLSNAGNLTMTRATVRGNTSADWGGGIVNSGTLTLTDSTLDHNTGVGGGGLANQDGVATLTNVTISGNSAGNGSGGGLRNVHGTIKLINVTVAGNSATGAGNAIAVDPSFNSSDFVQLKNTIVANSTSGGNCSGSISSLGHNLSSDNTCSSSFTSAGDLNNTDPQLGKLHYNGGKTKTRALLPGSPAIDAGANKGCPRFDQRGVTRPQDSDGDGIIRCDIGAYEVQATNPTTTPQLLYPEPNANVTTTRPTLDWSDVVWTARYQVELHQNSRTGPLILKKKVIPSRSVTPTLTGGGTVYFWRVRACNDLGCSAWAPFRKFMITP